MVRELVMAEIPIKTGRSIYNISQRRFRMVDKYTFTPNTISNPNSSYETSIKSFSIVVGDSLKLKRILD